MSSAAASKVGTIFFIIFLLVLLFKLSTKDSNEFGFSKIVCPLKFLISAFEKLNNSVPSFECTHYFSTGHRVWMVYSKGIAKVCQRHSCSTEKKQHIILKTAQIHFKMHSICVICFIRVPFFCHPEFISGSNP